MKNILVSFCLLFCTHFSFSQSFNTQIKSAKVYLNQAQVFSDAQAQIPAGRSTIFLTNIANGIDENSIQIGSDANFTLLNVRYLLDFNNKTKSPQIDTLNYNKDLLESKKMALYALEIEQKVLLDNSKFKGENSNLGKSELEEMLNYFNAKIRDIGNRKLKLNSDIKKLEEKIGFLEQDQVNNGNSSVLGKIELIIDSKTSQNAKIEASYMVFQAGWQPLYDVRVKDTKEPINMNYKANVWQNTGVQWNNVDLVLSTGNPNVNGQRPILYPQYLNFFVPYYDKVPAKLEEVQPGIELSSSRNMALAYDAPTVVQVESTFATEYEIKEKYSIASNRTATSVNINNINLNADFNYLAVPKLLNDVFLTATIKNYEKERLIPGPANIFFENVLVNKSYINGLSVDDSLQFGLGPDKRIIVKREEKRDYKNRKMIGSNIKEDFSYQITVKNTKNQSVELMLEDQVPVSQDSEIEVSLNDLSNAQKDETGKLTWVFQLKPMESKIINVSYTVKYPKNKRINNL